MMNEAWHKWAGKKGYRVSFGELHLLEITRKFLAELKSSNKINDTFYREWLMGFKYLNLEESMKESLKSLVLIAIPKPAYGLKFEYKGKARTAVLPPTYVDYKPTFKKIQAEAYAAFGKDKYRIEIIDAPLKSLAVLTGLAKYGRNNIVYVPEMGSYFQLVGLVTDMLLEPENTTNTLNIQDNLMSICSGCSACLKACPTGAIKEDRILLHAEKCYTPLSERAGELPPHILPPSVECLIGCMKCQDVCPKNIGKLHFIEAPFELTADDMDFLMENFDNKAPQWKKICEKFHMLKMSENTSIYIRNLRRLVDIKKRLP